MRRVVPLALWQTTTLAGAFAFWTVGSNAACGSHGSGAWCIAHWNVVGLREWGRLWHAPLPFSISGWVPLPPVNLGTVAFMHGLSIVLIAAMLGTLLMVVRGLIALAFRSSRLRALLAKAA